MATARDIVYRALKLFGALEPGESPDAADAEDVLATLNSMLAAWAVDGPKVFATTLESIALTPGTGSYTTANLSTATRPAEVESAAYLRIGTTDYPLELVARHVYQDVPLKSTQGTPEIVWYEPAMTGAFAFYPVPNAAATAYFNVRRVLTGTLVLGTTITLPEGYEHAITHNLAVIAAPLFGRSAAADTRLEARKSLALLKRQNRVWPTMNSPFDATSPDYFKVT